MRKILTNKRGVTILEGLIALTLLALVATGTFAVLLSASRKSTTPDIREEMILAIEKASRQIQAYVMAGSEDFSSATESLPQICDIAKDQVLDESQGHEIDCLLPPICDREGEKSKFEYKVTTVARASLNIGIAGNDKEELPPSSEDPDPYQINFTITCNGYTL